MTLIKNLFSNAAKDVIHEVGELAGNFVTTEKDKSKFKQLISETVLNKLLELAKLQADVLKTEMSGSKLQRNWRPVTMLCFTFIIMYYYFLSPVFGFPGIELPERFWSLLEIGLGGYVVGRSVEKVAETVTKNVDLTFLKKKDRKDAME